MHKGKYVFAQLLDFIDKDVFLRIANKYDGNRYVKQFTCWNQLAVLMFGQLSNRESLRDVVLATQAQASKAYHLGFGRHVAKSTLADANTNVLSHFRGVCLQSHLGGSTMLNLSERFYTINP